MKFVLIISTFCLTTLVSAQDILSTIPSKADDLGSFIPDGYDTIASVTGDLNQDKKVDQVLVLRSKLEESFDPGTTDIDSLPKRILLVLFKNGTGYKLAVKTSKAILCRQCGGVFGDPFESIDIKNGVLMIHHYGGSAWRWSSTHKFRYQENDFYLIGETSMEYWNVRYCEELGEFAGTHYKDTNLLTGAYEEKKLSAEECRLLVNKKGRIKRKPLQKLGVFTIDN